MQEGHLAMTEITSYLFKYVWIDMFSAFRIQQVLVKKKRMIGKVTLKHFDHY